MKPNKNKPKSGIGQRQKQRLTLKLILLASSGVFLAIAIPVLIVNFSNSISSSAQSTKNIEVVKINDQVFLNDKTLDHPVIIQQKQTEEKVIQIREKKIVDAQ